MVNTDRLISRPRTPPRSGQLLDRHDRNTMMVVNRNLIEATIEQIIDTQKAVTDANRVFLTASTCFAEQYLLLDKMKKQLEKSLV